MNSDRRQRISRLGFCFAAVCCAIASSARGIILYRTADPAANTTAPGGNLANSGWQYQGLFGDYLGTPIAPHFFITAQHIVFNSDHLEFGGVRYTLTKSFDDPGTDLRIFQVAETFPTFAPLYTGKDEIGKHLVVIGRGTQRGAAVTSGGLVRGWGWGAADKLQRWGENIVTATPQRPPGGDMIYALFNAPGLPNECHLSNGDSGGAVFLNDGGTWKLGGINYDVDGSFYTQPNGLGGFYAAIFDERGFYGPTLHFVSGSSAVPSGFYASRISTHVPWIESVIEPRLVNISTRAAVGTGDRVAIAGFILDGDPGQSRRIILRGLGASLGVNGAPFPGHLADPLIELHNASGALIASNDDWPNAPQAAELLRSGFAPGDARQAALAVTLPVGAYSVVLRGANGSSGVGLIEVYDVGAVGGARLLNLSGRGWVGTGDNVLIGGVTVRSLRQRLLLRAIGPELTVFGVSGALQNPVLELHNANGALIASNDDWQTGIDHAAISTTGLAPRDAREPAILLPPGAGQFTAIVRGASGSTGVALLEMYFLE